MVEVPAAALQARQLLEVADFLSIGTNDLSQYTLAADRQNGELTDLLDPWQPALLRLISACAEAGVEAGKAVGVCGEAASDPVLALVLVGLGVTSLSMSARSIRAVHAALAAHSLADCQKFAAIALDAVDHRAGRGCPGTDDTGLGGLIHSVRLSGSEDSNAGMTTDGGPRPGVPAGQLDGWP
jgi:phosphoenolpyruvate-protein phosphotransferase (PTS system enzyme I)